MLQSDDLWAKVPAGINKRYNVNYLCTDGLEAYTSFKLSNQHTRTKSETSLIESVNSRIRNYLARFNRKRALNLGKSSLTQSCFVGQQVKMIAQAHHFPALHLLEFDELWAKVSAGRTKRYSKSIDMVEYSLYLLFDKLYWKSLIVEW